MTIIHRELKVEWIGYSTVRIESKEGYVVYLDPGRYGVLDDLSPEDGDLVCVTHNHHYDSDGIERVADQDGTVIIYQEIDAEQIDRDVIPVEEIDREIVQISEKDYYNTGEAEVWSVPAYNESGHPHPKGSAVGYNLVLDGVSIFWPGDSDALEEFANLDVSLFLANIAGGGVVSDRHEAAELAEEMDPNLVLPIHYDTHELLEADAEAFAVDIASRGIPVVLDDNDLRQ